jgi:bla regulator protein BlaR1
LPIVLSWPFISIPIRDPVLALTLVKPGKLGPKLRPHAEGPPCDVAATRDNSLFPRICDVYNNQGTPIKPLWGSRNTTMLLLTGFLSSHANLGRSVVDETGLSGNFDFRLEWTADPDSSRDGPTKTMSKTGSNSSRVVVTGNSQAPASSDVMGPTLLEALREQLGLKLVSKTGSIEMLVVDHVERPSEN